MTGNTLTRLPLFALVLSGILITACTFGEIPQPGAVALVSVRVIDLNDGIASEPSDILIRDGRIEQVAATDPKAIPPSFTQFVFENAYVIPGLWDMHTHIQNDEELETFVPLLVAHGVVGFRDHWGLFPDEFAEHLADVPHAPRVVASARQMMGSNASTPAMARERVRGLAGRGVDFIKVQSDVPEDSFYAIIDEARLLGLDVAGHTPIGVSVSDASSAGLVTQEHMLEILFETSELGESIKTQRETALTSGNLSMGEYMLELGYPDVRPLLQTWSAERRKRAF